MLPNYPAIFPLPVHPIVSLEVDSESHESIQIFLKLSLYDAGGRETGPEKCELKYGRRPDELLKSNGPHSFVLYKSSKQSPSQTLPPLSHSPFQYLLSFWVLCASKITMSPFLHSFGWVESPSWCFYSSGSREASALYRR